MERSILLALLCSAVSAANTSEASVAAVAVPAAPKKDVQKPTPKPHHIVYAEAVDDDEQPKAKCLVRLLELREPNCGVDDPECPLFGPYHEVKINVSGNFRTVDTSYCPPYDWSCLRNPKHRRPCMRRKTFKIPLKPVVAATPVQLGLGWPRGGPAEGESSTLALDEVSPMQGAIGVLVNGVALNAVASKLSETLPQGKHIKGEDAWVDAGEKEEWMDDTCGGHLSGGGNYHTHVGALKNQKTRKACGLPEDKPNVHSELVGWAFDGYPIYGFTEGFTPSIGDYAPDDLDACGGHDGWHHTQEPGYHYHLAMGYPHSLECFHGCPEISNNARFKDHKCEGKAHGEL